MPRTPNTIGIIQPGSVAAKSGIQVGDRISSIAGQRVNTFEDLQRIVSLRPAERVNVTLERNGREVPLDLTLGVREEQDRFGQRFRIGLLGVGQTGRVMQRVPAAELIPAATGYTVGLTRSMIDGVVQIVTGRRSAKDLGGPLKIAQIAGQQASLGAFEFIQLLALFSINLGFINLLPVPMLDGGHLFFYAVEAIRRRPVSLQVQDWAFRGGLALILALLLFTTINDLDSFGLWDRLERLIG